MAWYDFFTGTPARTEQIQKFSPQQQSALNQLLSQGLQGVQPKNPQAFGSQFEPIANLARSEFQQQTIPSIAERFTSLGGGNNALSSPAFASQLGQAGAGLQENLAAQRAGFGLQQQQMEQSLAQNLLGMGLTPQFETLYHQRQPGFLESALGPGLQALMFYLAGRPGMSNPTPSVNTAALNNMGPTKATGSGLGLGGTPTYQTGFANPALWSPGMQNVLRPF